MKKLNKSTIIISASALIVGILIGWLMLGHPNNEKNTEHNHTIAEESETIWTCAMHPQIRQGEPGECPICGMDLIPLGSSNEELDPMALSMSPAAMQLAQVQTLAVGKGINEKSIQLNGKVQADERLLHTQSSHVSGRIEQLAVTFTGEFVSEGQLIARLYSPELVTAQQELLEAQKIAKTQPALFTAAKEKLLRWKLTENQMDQVLTSGRAIESFPILADVSGYVTEKMINLGDYVKQGEAIYQIADLSVVWVLFDVYESDMGSISKGDQVKFTIQSIPGRTFNGTISYIDPVIDPKMRVAKARVEQNNPDLLLKPEMFVSGKVEARMATTKHSLTVPKSAVMWTGTRSVVYVMQKSPQGISFIMRKVTLGPELGDSYVITSGLDAGEEIAVHGTFSIDAAAQLAGKPSMMNPDGGAAMTGHNHGNAKNPEPTSLTSKPKKLVLSNQSKTVLQPLFDHYFKMKDALASDDFEKAKKEAKQIGASLSAIDMNAFEAHTQNILKQQSQKLKESVKHIEHITEITRLRDSFMSISSAMIDLTENFNPLTTSVFVQRCPMANSYEGANWLSMNKEIHNPYFGAAMISCGETVRTIE